MLLVSKIRTISFDLDDTLWPIWPVIERAEKALIAWLSEHAPMTAALFASPAALQDIRQHMHDVILKKKPEIAHDLSAIRRESIRLALYRAGDNPLLADAAFDAFFAERNRVVFYDDALPAIQALARRYPLVSLSNGNAQLDQVGLAPYFKAALSATGFGIAKPDARIFNEAARLAGVQAHEVLHVGDDATADVMGAIDAGMQAVWLNRQGKLWPHERESASEGERKNVQPTLEIASLSELTALLC